MKGKITLREKEGSTFEGLIDIEVGPRGKLVELEEKEGKGERLNIYVRAQKPDHLICVIHKKMIIFELDEVVKEKELEVAGEDIGNGESVPWTCSFQKTED